MRNVLAELDLALDDIMYEKYVKRNWEMADLDGSGRITLEEFFVMFSKIFAPASRYGQILRLAASRGDNESVKELVARGCDPNGRDGAGFTTLHHAAEFGHTRTIVLLKELRRDMLTTDPVDARGWTPLMNAASGGHLDAARRLVEMGAAIHHANHVGRNALHWAAINGHDAMCRF